MSDNYRENLRSMHGNPAQERGARNISPVARSMFLLLAAAGLLVRLLPLFDSRDHLFWFFMTEDGYLMQTVARNMAIGLGMSTAEGTIPTNGVQPLATFLFAALHLLAGSSRELAITYVTIASALIGASAAWVLYRLGRVVLRGSDAAEGIALFAAACWFASPLVTSHSMNGLETGLYYLAIVSSLVYYYSLDLGGPTGIGLVQRLLLGVALGITFLARNDAVFFIGALLLAHVAIGGISAGGGWKHRLVDAVVAGMVSVAVASPWLVHNQQEFGSIIPISGLAESHGATFGGNLPSVPANLLEAALLYVPVPRALETMWPVFLFSLVVVAGIAWGSWVCIGRLGLGARRFLVVAWLFCAGLCGYYGLFFGALHFLSRYLSALTPFFALMSVATAWFLLANWLRLPRILDALCATASVVLLAGSTARWVMEYRREPNNGHRQVVGWIQQNVPANQWVGAIQTGTLGYFHDRTINLDGKVNPDALRELQRTGDVRSYVVHQTPIDYLADWSAIAGWVAPGGSSDFNRAFEVVVSDAATNLGVLRRITPIQGR